MKHADQNISRRTCLAGAAALVAAGWTPRAVFAASGERQIDIGMITEPTASHRTNFLKCLAACRGVRSVAYVDLAGNTIADAERRLGDRFGRAYRSPQEMLAAVRPQLTVVTTEGQHAPSAVLAALQANSHVLTEKPSCTKLGEFETIAALAEERERHVMLAMATRSSPAIEKARQLVADGVIGQPYSVSMVWIADQARLTRPAYHASWLADPEKAGGGKLIYHGIHYLDVIQHVLGDSIRDITGFAENVGGQPIEIEDSAVLSFRFAGGATGTLNTGYYLGSSKQSEIRIWGSHGWLQLQHFERQPLKWYSSRDASAGVQTYEYTDEPGLYQLFFQEAIDAVRNETPPPINTRESLRALRGVFAAYQAAATGRTQSIKIDG